MTSLKFNFRPVLTILSAIAFAILIILGNWQVQRLEWKRALIEQTAQISTQAPVALGDVLSPSRVLADDEYSVVMVKGVVAGDGEFVFGAIEGQPGVFHFVPLKTSQGIVYINRGFIPQAVYKSGNFRSVATGATLSVEGLLRAREIPRPPASWVVSRTRASDGLWGIRDPLLFAEADGLAGAQPLYVDAFAVPDIDYPKGGTTRIVFSNRHLEYALTWFGLAGALVAVWIAMSFSRIK